MTVQISITQLENLIEVAKLAQKNDDSLCNTISVEVTQETNTHTGTDKCNFWLLSKYAECNGQFLGVN